MLNLKKGSPSISTSVSRRVLLINLYPIFPVPIIPVFHYSIIPIGAKPLYSQFDCPPYHFVWKITQNMWYLQCFFVKNRVFCTRPNSRTSAVKNPGSGSNRLKKEKISAYPSSKCYSPYCNEWTSPFTASNNYPDSKELVFFISIKISSEATL